MKLEALSSPVQLDRITHNVWEVSGSRHESDFALRWDHVVWLELGGTVQYSSSMSENFRTVEVFTRVTFTDEDGNYCGRDSKFDQLDLDALASIIARTSPLNLLQCTLAAHELQELFLRPFGTAVAKAAVSLVGSDLWHMDNAPACMDKLIETSTLWADAVDGMKSKV